MNKLLLASLCLPGLVWGMPFPPPWQAGNCTQPGETWSKTPEGFTYMCVGPSRRGGNCLGVHYPQVCYQRAKDFMVCEPAYVGLDPKCPTAKPTGRK